MVAPREKGPISMRAVTGQFKAFYDAALRSLALTFFSPDKKVGLLLLISILVFDPLKGILGVFGMLAAYTCMNLGGRHQEIKNSGIIELNGWYVGLAAGSFIDSPFVALVSCILSGALIPFSCKILHRLLRPWGLPVLVLPYIPVVHAWHILSKFSKIFPFRIESVQATEQNTFLVQVFKIGMTGFSQIAFSQSFSLGLALAGIFVYQGYKARREIWLTLWIFTMPFLLGACGLLLDLPVWFQWGGLACFPCVIIASAFMNGFLDARRSHLAFFLVISLPVELCAVHIFSSFGLLALSSGYVLTIFGFLLSQEVRKVADGRAVVKGIW
jgi:urea transporter